MLPNFKYTRGVKDFGGNRGEVAGEVVCLAIDEIALQDGTGGSGWAETMPTVAAPFAFAQSFAIMGHPIMGTRKIFTGTGN